MAAKEKDLGPNPDINLMMLRRDLGIKFKLSPRGSSVQSKFRTPVYAM